MGRPAVPVHRYECTHGIGRCVQRHRHPRTGRDLPMTLEDARSVIVTGAASGIGRAIAERLVDDGLHVLAVDLEPDRRHARRAVRGGPHDPRGQPRRRRCGARALRPPRRHRPERRLPARRAGGRVPRGPLGRAAGHPAHEPVPAGQVRVAGAGAQRRRAHRRRRLGARARGVAVQGRLRLGQARRHGPGQDAGARGRATRGSPRRPCARASSARRWSRSRSATRRARTDYRRSASSRT